MLTNALSQTGAEDGQLQIIIETIEPDQYESIANTSDKVLVVQGAAGSGKSEIGFHRIAYLLSPFNDVPERERPTPGSTLFVGPSQAFPGVCVGHPPPARSSAAGTADEVQSVDHRPDVPASSARREDLEKPACARGESAVQRAGRALQGLNAHGRRH